MQRTVTNENDSSSDNEASRSPSNGPIITELDEENDNDIAVKSSIRLPIVTDADEEIDADAFEAISLTAEEKHFLVQTIHQDYAHDILVEIQLKKNNKNLQFNDVIADQSNLKNLYVKLQGLEMISQVRAKNDNIQRIIKRYVDDLIQVSAIKDEKSFAIFYNALKISAGSASSLSYLSYLINITSYPDDGLDKKLLDISVPLAQQLRGIAILLNLPRQMVQSLPHIKQQVDFLQESMNEKIQEATAERRSQNTASNTRSSSESSDPFTTFAHFFGNKQPAKKTSTTTTHSNTASVPDFISGFQAFGDSLKAYPSKVIDRNKQSDNPLMYAIAHGKPIADIEKIIKKNRTIALTTDSDGNNAIHLAVLVARPDIRKLLHFLSDSAVLVSGRNKYDMTVTHMAAAGGCSGALQALMEMGAPMDSKMSAHTGMRFS